MPSKLHQMLVGLIGRKMREMGYEIVAFDGSEYQFDGVVLPIPPSIGKHRPDILGIKMPSRDICIGEAKTHEDLRSKRTARQLIDFSKARTRSNIGTIELIIGIPESAEPELIKLLIKLDLYRNRLISYIRFPEVLVDEKKESQF